MSKDIAGHLDDEWEKLWEATRRQDFGRALRLLLSNAGMTDPHEKRNENVLHNGSNKHLAGGNTDQRLIPYNDGIVTCSRKSVRNNIMNGSLQTRVISIRECPRNEKVMTCESNKHFVRENTRRLILSNDEMITHPRKQERKNIINGSQTHVISIRGSPNRDFMARENKNKEIIRVVSQPQPHDQPGCSSTKYSVENQIRSSKLVNRNNVDTRDQKGEIKGVVWKGKEYFYERRAPRDFWKVKGEHEYIEQARCVQKYPNKSRKLADGLNVAKRDHLTMVKVRNRKIELTDEVGQSKKDDAQIKRSRKKLNKKDAFEINNEANRRVMILNKNKYFYEKCSRVINNVTEDRHANVNRAQPVKGKRLIRGDYEYGQNGLVQKGNKRLEENHGKRIDQFRLDKREVVRSGKEFNKMITQVSEANKRPVIVLDSEDSYEESGPFKRNCFNHVTEYTVESQNQLKKEVKEEGQKGNCNKLHEKNSIEKIEEKDSDDDTSTEVEILDSDEVIRHRNLSSFVPSTIYRSDLGVSKASSGYRERVLNVLKKPFDKEEYRRLSEEVKFYLDKYPDLKKKLKKYRYKRLTRMTILRGFFYWLQNVMHDGAFQPWEDPQCLAVQPGSGQEN